MKKFLKAISMITAMFVLLLSMASCSGYSFYKDFKEAGASIEEENIFIEISLEDAKTKKAAGELKWTHLGLSDDPLPSVTEKQP